MSDLLPLRAARRTLLLAAAWAVGALLLAGASAPEARAQQGAEQGAQACSLAEAEQRYLDGAFDAVARLATRCLDAEAASESQRIRAHQLLVLARLRQDDRKAARSAAVALLQDAPRYTPDAVQDPPFYVKFVSSVRREMRAAGRLPRAPGDAPPSWFERRQTWLAIGGGLLVAGLLAIFGGS